MSPMTNGDADQIHDGSPVDAFALESGSLLSHLPKNSIFGNIRSTFIWLLATLLLSGAIGTSAIVFMYSSESGLINRLEPLVSANNNFLVHVIRARSATKSYLLDGNGAFIGSFNHSVSSYNSDYALAVKLESSSEKRSGVLQRENQAAQAAFLFYHNTLLNEPGGSANLGATFQLFLKVDKVFSTFDLLNVEAASLFQNNAVAAQKTAQRVAISAELFTAIFALVGLYVGYRRADKTRREIALLFQRLKATLGLMGGKGRGWGRSIADDSGVSEEQELVLAINAMAGQKRDLIKDMELQVAQERELREGLEYERSLRETLGRTLYRDLDAVSALQRTIDGLGASLHADRAIIRAIENGLPGEVVAKWNSPSHKEATFESASEIDQIRTIIYGEAEIFGHAIKAGVVLAVNDIASDERVSLELREKMLRTGLLAFLSVPVIGAGGTEAVLVAQMLGRTRAWTDRDIELAETMAGGLAATLAAVRLYEQERSNVKSMKALDTAKDDFLTSVSHELRTPLSSIVGYLELLQDEAAEGNLPLRYSRMLDAIDRNSHRLLDLIDNILTTSRIDSDKLELNLTTFHLSTLLIRVAETAMPQVKAKNIDLQININDRMPDLTGDIGLLERALLNLLSNAIKFCRPEGAINITARLQGKFITLAVRDSGIGIPTTEIDSLFTKFFRTSTARQNAVQGTGLGLVIVKAIIERHKGSISVTSEIGAWTEFMIELPY